MQLQLRQQYYDFQHNMPCKGYFSCRALGCNKPLCACCAVSPRQRPSRHDMMVGKNCVSGTFSSHGCAFRRVLFWTRPSCMHACATRSTVFSSRLACMSHVSFLLWNTHYMHFQRVFPAVEHALHRCTVPWDGEVCTGGSERACCVTRTPASRTTWLQRPWTGARFAGVMRFQTKCSCSIDLGEVLCLVHLGYVILFERCVLYAKSITHLCSSTLLLGALTA